MITESRGTTIDMVDLLCFGGNYPTVREPHTGIFTGCIGELENVQYINNSVTVRNVEDLILEEFKFRDIDLPWQEFAHDIKITWNKYFPVLAENLQHVAEFTLDDETENVTETVNVTQNATTHTTGRDKYSDTPNQYVASGADVNGLTSISDASADGTSENTGNSSRTLETSKGHNRFERWLELSYKNRNIIYDFIDRFRELFKTTYIIYTRR